MINETLEGTMKKIILIVVMMFILAGCQEGFVEDLPEY